MAKFSSSGLPHYSLGSCSQLSWACVFLLLFIPPHSVSILHPALQSLSFLPHAAKVDIGFHSFLSSLPWSKSQRLAGAVLTVSLLAFLPHPPTATQLNPSNSCSKPQMMLLAWPIGLNPAAFHGIQRPLQSGLAHRPDRHHPLLYLS